MRKYIQSIAVIFIIVILVTETQLANAAVDLLYFRTQSGLNSVTLQWETATEIDNAGFYIQRSLEINAGYQRITSFIASQGDQFTGHYYEYNDQTVSSGILYYYMLEIVSASGNSEYSDVVNGIINGPTPTSTMTQSINPTNTTTPTSTNVVSIPTSTLTRTATVVPTRSNPTPSATAPTGPTQTITPAYTPSQTPTTTLMPLPAITLIFPAYTATTTVTANPQSSSISDTNTSQDNSDRSVYSQRLKLLIIVVIILWVVLALFLVIYFRQVKQ